MYTTYVVYYTTNAVYYSVFIYHKRGIVYHICSILYNKCSIVYHICGIQFYDISTLNLEKICKIPKILTILECLPWCVILKSEIIVYHKCGILYYICCVVYCICSIVYYICGIHKWENWGKFQKCYFHLEFWKKSFRF